MANKMSKMRELLSEGNIAAYYTLDKYFVKIGVLTSIDKVKFAFVMKGSNGKKNFDIYVDILRFQQLVNSILNGKFKQDLINDKEKAYPEAWKYDTGTNLSKHLAIGCGNRGLVIQGRITGNNAEQAFVPVGANLEDGYHQLEDMARLFNIVTGYTPTTGYYASLRKTFENAMERIDKYHSGYSASEDDANYVQPSQDEPSQAPSGASGSNNMKGAFVAIDAVDMKDGGFYVNLSADRQHTNTVDFMIFTPDVIQKNADILGKFKSHVEEETHTDFKAEYRIHDNHKYFVGFLPKNTAA